MGSVQVSIYDPDITTHVHAGASWDVVVEFGEKFNPHNVWFLKRSQFDALIQNLLTAQLAMAIGDAEQREKEST